MFKKLSEEKLNNRDDKIIKFWQKENILQKSINQNKDYFVFYDGPATANGMPGIHHLLAKLLKDTICKYQAMNGKKVLRKIGWDTHGLPVEVEVEKELKFSGKEDIEKYGIKKFNEKCKESVWRNEKSFSDVTLKMGQFIDLEHPYVTYDNSYIETEWWILKKMHEAGLIYEGLKIVPYCPRCGTGLASHEVAQGYKEISVNSVIVPFKKSDEDTYFLVWTTTPWTLLANVALCVNPKEEYVKVKSMGYNFILAKKLASKVLGEDIEIVETYRGKDLEKIQFDQLLPFIKPTKKAFYVVCDEYVTMEDGTGIVHIAPAFGEDDYKVSLNYNLPSLNPVDEEGKYTEGPWQGRFVLDPELEIEIIKYLKDHDKLFKKQKLNHNYPHCWRCQTPLIYYSKPSLYFKTSAIKEKMIKANKEVIWHPDFVGEKRFNNWLENAVDWAISRNRYWGTPIPLWRCSCGHEEMIGSREELKEKAIEQVDVKTIDLHRPYVDDIHIKCPVCGKKMKRIKDVIDCWFDSGAMPFAQYHYPFENEKLWKTQFPGDFISEGIDQTRGWFYSLLIISTFLTDKAPYKNVLVNDLVLDENGQKMSKSRGNIVRPFEMIEKYGADAIRWYMLFASPVWTPLKFDENGVKEVAVKFFNTLKNTYNFFQIYANIDKINISKLNISYEDLDKLDKWLLSKYNQLIKNVDSSFKDYDLYRVVKYINSFVIDDLSNWYIRRSRDRFWQSEFDNSKLAVYQTTYEVLVGLTKLIAPISPFLVEEMYQALTGELSVHLAVFPKSNKDYINSKLEKEMDLVRDLISLGRQVRDNKAIKVRQPLQRVIIDAKNKKTIGNLVELMKDELNVKEVIFEEDLNKYMNIELKPNFKVVGPKLGNNMKLFQDKLANLDIVAINKLQNNQSIKLNLAGKDFLVDKEMVELRVNAKEGYDAAYQLNNFIIVDTKITKELINEGLAREFISRIQNFRKDLDFNIMDRINIYYSAPDEVVEAINNNLETIKKETLAEEIKLDEKATKEFEINNYLVKIELKNLTSK